LENVANVLARARGHSRRKKEDGKKIIKAERKPRADATTTSEAFKKVTMEKLKSLNRN
jgi:hypothetical protein